jgi:hypothetical protein
VRDACKTLRWVTAIPHTLRCRKILDDRKACGIICCMTPVRLTAVDAGQSGNEPK